MATRARSNQPTQSSAGLIVGVGMILALVATWFAQPGFFVLWIAMVVAAFLEPPATLTGPKKNGYPTPINDLEEMNLSRSGVWKRLRLTLLLPAASLPGWPVLGIWIASVLVSIIALMFPADVLPQLLPPGSPEIQQAQYEPLMRVANAVSAFTVITAFAEANRRRFEGNPGTRIDSLIGLVKSSPIPTIVKAVLGAAGAVGMLVALHIYGGPQVQQFTDKVTMVPVVLTCAGLLGAGAACWSEWSKAALARWRLIEDAKAEWTPRWVGIKQDPPPTLVDRVIDEEHGVTVDTFDAQRHLGSGTMIPLAPKLAPAVGAGRDLVLLNTPMAPDGQPQPGTADPVRFRAVTWDSSAFPDLTNPKLPAELVELAAEFALARLVDGPGYDRMLPVAIEKITTDESPTAAYQSLWEGTHIGTLRIGKMMGAASGMMKCKVLADHRALGGNGVLYFGDLESDDVIFIEDDMRKKLADIANEDWWTSVWETGSPSQLSANTPTISVPMYAEGTLADGTVVKRQPFVTRQGVDPRSYFGSEGKLAASLGAVPYVAITGWPGQSQRPGERHPQALCVYWSTSPVPATIDALSPVEGGSVAQVDIEREPGARRDRDGRRSPARSRPVRPKASGNLPTTWVIAGKINKAFTAAKLARPEIVSAHALTTQASRRHLWKIQLRLHDGVTLDEVRAKAEKLRTDLGVPWLRVVDAPDGCIIAAGAEPARATLVNPTTDGAWLTSLDWEQAFLDANLTGSGGLLPKLQDVGRLPNNENVQVIDFSLPSGLSADRIKGVVKKLKASTGNDFVEMRPATRGASSFRLMVSETNPLPERAPFDFDRASSDRKVIYFATGVEGEPVGWEIKDMPHVLVAGVTGGGKSVAAQNFLWGWAVHGDLVCVIDPMKQAADFQFLNDYAYGFAVDIFEAAALLKAVYAEVKRRMSFNAQNKVGSYLDLPDDVRPKRILVFIDEFTSLMGKDVVPAESDDPEEMKERELVIAVNSAKATIGTFTGKIAREARSAGVHLALGTQKLTAKTLDTIPGAGDLKTNLGRMLLGNASLGDRQSALRAPLEAPDIDSFPAGRGLWEPLTMPSSVAIQTWFAPQAELAAALTERIEPISEQDKIDFTPYLPKNDDDEDGEFGPPPNWGQNDEDDIVITPITPVPGDDIEDVELDLDLSTVELDELALDLDLDEDLDDTGTDQGDVEVDELELTGSDETDWGLDEPGDGPQDDAESADGAAEDDELIQTQEEPRSVAGDAADSETDDGLSRSSLEPVEASVEPATPQDGSVEDDEPDEAQEAVQIVSDEDGTAELPEVGSSPAVPRGADDLFGDEDLDDLTEAAQSGSDEPDDPFGDDWGLEADEPATRGGIDTAKVAIPVDAFDDDWGLEAEPAPTPAPSSSRSTTKVELPSEQVSRRSLLNEDDPFA